jgi:hypothetical protein
MSNIDDKIADAFQNFHLNADKDTVKRHLNEIVEDSAEYEKRKKKLAFLAKATAAKKHNEYLLSLVKTFQDAILMNVEKPIAMLKQLIAQKNSLALYRNLNQLSKEDIIEIIKDKNLVELLEQLDEDDKKH